MLEKKVLQCFDCGREFDFTPGEQKFYQEKGFQEPKRCKPCRQANKQNRDDYSDSERLGRNASYR